MSLELSEYEIERLNVTWLVSKNIKAPEFKRKFNAIWDKSKKEIQDIIKKCGHTINLQNSKKIGLTLKPNKTFAFSPQNNAYLINVWFFLLCNDEQRACIKPSWYLANYFVHEYNHYEFFRDHDMLLQDKKTTEHFIKAHYKEAEEKAYLKEINFLKNAETLAPKSVNTRFFSVKSWSKTGIPYCEVENAKISIDTKMFIEQMNCEANRRKLNSLSKCNYDNIMSTNKKSLYDDLSKILNLSFPTDNSPIVEIPL